MSNNNTYINCYILNENGLRMKDKQNIAMDKNLKVCNCISTRNAL